MGRAQATQSQGSSQGGYAPGIDAMSYLPSLIPLATGLIGGAAMGSPGMGLAAGAMGGMKSAGSQFSSNREAQARAQALAEVERKRTAGQGAGARIAGLSDPALLDAIAGADEKTFGDFIKLMGAHGASKLTSQFAGDAGYEGYGPTYQSTPGGGQSFEPVAGEAYQSMLVPQMRQMSQFAHENPTAAEIQAAISGDTGGLGGGGSVANRMDSLVSKNMLNFMKTQPNYNPDAMNTQLGNEYKGGVLESAVGAKNAENQGMINTAIPLATEALKAKSLGNTTTVQENKRKDLEMTLKQQKEHREQIKDNLDNTAKSNQVKVDTFLSEKDYSVLERTQGFQDAVSILNQKEADPDRFREQAMKVLKRANLPPEKLQKYVDYIENLRVMKIQEYSQDPNNVGDEGGILGMGKDATNQRYQQYMDELKGYQK